MVVLSSTQQTYARRFDSFLIHSESVCRASDPGVEAVPIATTQDFEQDLTVHIVTGRISEQEMFATLENFYEHRFTTLLLWDMSQADLQHVTPDILQRFVRRAAELGVMRRGGRTAVVGASALQYGLARMSGAFTEMHAAPYAFRAFRTHEQALAWLKSDRSLEQ